MSAEFNPYREWLGLDRDEPPDYYTLIGVSPGEGDIGRLHAEADRAIARVRSFRPGPRARQWAALLDELNAAKECLSDPARRADYDRQLETGAGTAAATPETAPAARLAGEEMTAETVEQHASTVVPSSSFQEFMLPPTRPPQREAPSDDSPATSNAAPPARHVESNDTEMGHPSDQLPDSAAHSSDDDLASVVPFLEPVEPPPSTDDPMSAFEPDPDGPDPMAPLTPSPEPPPAPPAAESRAPATSAGPMLQPVTADSHLAPVPDAGFPGDAFPHEATTESHESTAERRRPPVAVMAIVAAAMVLSLILLLLQGPGSSVPDSNSAETSSPDIAENDRTSSSAASRSGAAANPQPTRLAGEPQPGASGASPSAAAAVSRPAGQQPGTNRPSGSELPNTPNATEDRTGRGDATTTAAPAPTPLAGTQTRSNPSPSAASRPTPSTSGPPAAPAASSAAEPATAAPPLSDAERQQLSKMLGAARRAIESREWETASERIAAAEPLAREAPLAAKLRRLQMLSQLAQEFYAAVNEALEKLAAGDEVPISTSTRVTVVELTAGKLVIRLLGTDREYPRDRLPPGLTTALAARTLGEENARLPLLEGAFWAARPGTAAGDLERIRRNWEDAATVLPEVRDLLPVLDDTYE